MKKWWEKFIFSRARQVWGWSPARKEALRAALVAPNRWRCSKCGALVDSKNRDVDHQWPVIDPEIGWVNWDSYFSRLLDVSSDRLDVVCKACHKEKTSAENKVRRAKRQRKPKAKKEAVVRVRSRQSQ